MGKPDGSLQFNQAEFDKIWPRLRVLARSSPEDKLTLANGLNQSLLFQDGEVCARLKAEDNITIFPDRQVVTMTGDGTNDAPALKRADVGFAMGISGTQIAKDAADIILMDDNFASIVTAANWGRNVFDSISKFIQFQLTVNIAALACTVIGVLRERPPIKAVQMLWVNLIMDSLASVALSFEPPTPDQMNRPPVNRSTSIISQRMWCNMLGHSLYQCVVMITMMQVPALCFSEKDDDPDNKGWDGIKWEEENEGYYSKQYTVVFNTFVLMHCFCARRAAMAPGHKFSQPVHSHRGASSWIRQK